MLKDAAPLRRAAPNPADPSSRDYPKSRKQIGSQNAILPIAWWASLNEGVATTASSAPQTALASGRREAKEQLMFQVLRSYAGGAM
jgi:hypothetical protein